MKMKKCFTAIALIMLVFYGGIGAVATEGEISVPVDVAPVVSENPALPKDIIFWLRPDEDKLMVEAAAVFCEKISSLTNGKMKPELRESADIASELIEGSASFAFAGKGSVFSSGMERLSEPFAYTGYDDFSMTVNSRRALDLAASDTTLDAVPLAVYYNGASHFLSPFSLASTIPLKRAIETEGELTGLLRAGSGAASGLERLGVTVKEVPDANERGEQIFTGWAGIAEFTDSELYELGQGGSGLILTLTYHEIDARWLVAGGSFYSGLSAFHRAAVQEAAAFLFPLIGDGAISREKLVVEKLSAEGVEVSADFDGVREAAGRRAQTYSINQNME